MDAGIISDKEDFVLNLLATHGPMRFTTADDLTACETLTIEGYIRQREGDLAKSLTPKGRRYIRERT